MKTIISLSFVFFMVFTAQTKATLIEFSFETYNPGTTTASGNIIGSFIVDDALFNPPGNSLQQHTTILGSDLFDFNFNYGALSFDHSDVDLSRGFDIFTYSSSAYDLRYYSYQYATTPSVITHWDGTYDINNPYMAFFSNSGLTFGNLHVSNFSTSQTIFGFWTSGNYTPTATTVTEPSVLALIGLGLAGLRFSTRKK